jgi:hypothetical protein
MMTRGPFDDRLNAQACRCRHRLRPVRVACFGRRANPGEPRRECRRLCVALPDAPSRRSTRHHRWSLPLSLHFGAEHRAARPCLRDKARGPRVSCTVCAGGTAIRGPTDVEPCHARQLSCRGPTLDNAPRRAELARVAAARSGPVRGGSGLRLTRSQVPARNPREVRHRRSDVAPSTAGTCRGRRSPGARPFTNRAGDQEFKDGSSSRSVLKVSARK